MAAFVPNSSVSRRQSFSRTHLPTSLSATGSPFESVVMFQQTPSFSLADATTTTLPSGETFEPILPDSTTLIAFGCIIALSALAVWVWSNQVVPVSRTNLALSKKKGPVKDYLDELREAEKSAKSIDATANVTVVRSSHETEVPADAASTTPVQDTRALERWLFTDWLSKDNASKPGRQKEPALPVLKGAKWNSGDNPVLVASALIMGGVFFTAVTERVTSSIF